MAKVDLSKYRRQMTQLVEKLEDLPRAAQQEFIRQTPVRSGNARRNTRLEGTKIVADYAYSQRLEEGYSSQAPDGMIMPTEQWIQDEVDRRLKGL